MSDSCDSTLERLAMSRRSSSAATARAMACASWPGAALTVMWMVAPATGAGAGRSEEHTSELQSQSNLVCRLLLEKKKTELENNSHIVCRLVLEKKTHKYVFF